MSVQCGGGSKSAKQRAGTNRGGGSLAAGLLMLNDNDNICTMLPNAPVVCFGVTTIHCADGNVDCSLHNELES